MVRATRAASSPLVPTPVWDCGKKKPPHQKEPTYELKAVPTQYPVTLQQGTAPVQVAGAQAVFPMHCALLQLQVQPSPPVCGVEPPQLLGTLAKRLRECAGRVQWALEGKD